MRASARWAIALSGRRVQQLVPDIRGGGTVADPGEGARKTILPIGTKGFQIRCGAVVSRRFLPSLKFGEKVGKSPPCLSIGRVRGYGRPKTCFGRDASAGIPESIACDQGSFRDVGRDIEIELEPVSIKIGVSVKAVDAHQWICSDLPDRSIK